jgi:sigma-B regulation protein RsbQ
LDRKSETIRRHHATIRGKGKASLVFAHGFGCDQTMWRFVAPAIEEHYRVVTFDHIGVGHSVGAMMGALASIRHPELFTQLIMIGPSPRYLDDGGFSRKAMDDLFDLLEANYPEWPKKMAPMIIGNPDRPGLAEAWSSIFCRNDPEIAKRFARVIFLSDNRAKLARIPTPTIILQTSDDVIAGEWVGDFVQKSIKGSRLIKLSATGRRPNLSHPDEVIAVLKTYLLPDMTIAAKAS